MHLNGSKTVLMDHILHNLFHVFPVIIFYMVYDLARIFAHHRHRHTNNIHFSGRTNNCEKSFFGIMYEQ